MAKSAARKKREKMKNDPTMMRVSWNGVNPLTKKTPTLVEKQRRAERKYKRSYDRGDYNYA